MNQFNTSLVAKDGVNPFDTCPKARDAVNQFNTCLVARGGMNLFNTCLIARDGVNQFNTCLVAKGGMNQFNTCLIARNDGNRLYTCLSTLWLGTFFRLPRSVSITCLVEIVFRNTCRRTTLFASECLDRHVAMERERVKSLVQLRAVLSSE